MGDHSCKTRQEAGQGTRHTEDKGSSNRKAAAEEAGVREARCAHTAQKEVQVNTGTPGREGPQGDGVQGW